MADFVIAGTVTKISGSSSTGIAGEAITQGDWLYVDLTDSNKMAVADTTTALGVAALVAGVAEHDALAGQPITYARRGAVMEMGSNAVTLAKTYVLSVTGAMAPIEDLALNDWATTVGYSTSASPSRFTVSIIAMGVQVPV